MKTATQYQISIAHKLACLVHSRNRYTPHVDMHFRVAEIGVNLGETSRFLLNMFPNLKMVLVDPRKPPQLTRLVNQFQKRVQFLQDISHDAASAVPGNSLDLVFIDAQHTYENVKEDIHDWAPKLRADGIMGGHDLCDEFFPGVRQAVEETGLDYESDAGYTWWFKQCPKGLV